MDNNDILIRLRYAMDIKDAEMVEIFKLGGIELTVTDVRKLLIKSKDSYRDDADDIEDIEEMEENLKCNNNTLESFLNGYIILKRGQKDSEPRQSESLEPPARNREKPNNMLLKKMKIALSLTSEDMLDIFKKTGITVTKGELSALLRKEGHKNYKECGDKYARNFLKGLAMKNRG